jgi:hypothetical protein
MINLIGNLSPETKVLDFECGSGGYFAGVIDKGVGLENIRGIDIDELPHIIAKTYIALYFKKSGKENIDALPIRKDNGLFYQGNNWDLVIGNPAGSSKYEHGNIKKILAGGLGYFGDKENTFSEYELSIQQAVRSAAINGTICLVLPEGFFSNSQAEYLRKFVAKHCRVLAIISLPRGAFKKGTSVKQQQKGAQTSSQKMSILYARKIKEIDKSSLLSEVDFASLNYPVFLANISEPDSKVGNIDDWLEPCLDAVFKQWQSWQKDHKLIEMPAIKMPEQSRKAIETPDIPFAVKPVPEIIKPSSKPPTPKSKTSISKDLEDLL